MTEANLTELLQEAADAKVQTDQWEAIAKEAKGELLAAMMADSMKTFTADIEVGNTTATVVAPESTMVVDLPKLRRALQREGFSTRAINQIIVPVKSEVLDEDALNAVIQSGQFRSAKVPFTNGPARNPYVKLTIRPHK